MTNPRRMQMATAGQGGAGFFEISGNLWGSGEGEWLGDNTTTNKSSPVQIKSGITDWGQCYIGDDTAVAITNTGDIYTWGEGQAAATRVPITSSPVLISGGAGSGGWSNLAGASDSWAAIKDGKLYTCGKNGFGQLGQGDTVSRSSPVQVGSATNWASVGGSNRETFAINESGQLFSCGYNSYGRLGHGDSTDRSTLTQVGSLTNWLEINYGGNNITVRKTDGTLWSWGEGSAGSNGQGDTVSRSSPVQVGSATNWTKVGGGGQTTIGLNSSNELWICGRNDDGQLGLNISTSTNKSVLTQIPGAWTDFTTTGSSVAAIKVGGTLWAWGQNNVGQLGVGNTTNYSSPVQVGSLTSWIGCAGRGCGGNSLYYLR